jgi:hypothetical protein
MGTKHFISINLSCFIEPHNSHRPFFLSHIITISFYTPVLCKPCTTYQLRNTILTNHTPPTKSPYQPPTLNVNVEPQHNIFPITLNNRHVEPSPLSILLTPIVAHDQIPQPTPIFPTCLKPPLKTFCPTYGHQFTLQGLTHHQCS